ncbi:SUMF1/EgtB/PvdO family nonheme iron enzyme [Candidatus Latescibacterota bacterium]
MKENIHIFNKKKSGSKNKKSKKRSIIHTFFHLIIRCLKSQIFIGILIGFLILFLAHEGIRHTSTDTFCAVCHVHPEATYSWKKSTHYKNESGVVVHCIECHLPPDGIRYFSEKTRLGLKDAYGTIFKDTENIDWDAKSVLEHAVTYTFDSSCIRCHDDLYSLGLTPKGVQAHEYYMKMKDTISCINCHITVGHFQKKPDEEFDYLAEEAFEQPEYPLYSGEFANYSETIPGTDVTFNMVAISGGTFNMGSPETEQYRNTDESLPLSVEISSFWMGETELTWREFDFYYRETSVKGRNYNESLETETVSLSEETVEVDAVTGPTPPYGSPSQGWGKGSRPAITMTYHTAVKYCEWLSEKTGATYRLPTEAEWEYACRAGTTKPYYFEGEPKKLTQRKWTNKLFGIDSSIIDKHVWYASNSSDKTQPAYSSEPNAWGLYNMLGNVKEFCLDWYIPDPFTNYDGASVIVNPSGPEHGTEHVVRGGSFRTDPADLRSAARDRTYHDEWMMTDPQSPKSIWWYSDVKDVGFRIVCEIDKK